MMIDDQNNFNLIDIIVMSRLLGRATKADTFRFIEESKLPFSHLFKQGVDFMINPIIHGPPRYLTNPTSADLAIETAVIRNRSNCLYIYNNTSEAKWASPILPDLMRVYAKEVNRNMLVTIAGLGKAHELLSVDNALEEALELCRLECIDMVVIEATSTSFIEVKRLGEHMGRLEALCQQGKLAGFGVHMSVPPYMHHSPMRRQSQSFSMMPALFEERLVDFPHCALMLYNICPSHQMPATHPLLDHPGQEEWAVDDEFKREHKRKFTRAAVDPLTCYHGLGTVGLDVDDDDVDFSPENIRSLEEKGQKMEQSGVAMGGIDDKGEYSFPMPSSSSSPTLMPTTAHAQASVEHETLEEDVHQPLILISGVHPPQLEHSIAQALDDVCPALQSTYKLEDKAIRISLSVGAEVVVVEANQSAKIAKLGVSKRDLLSSDETVDVFGTFVVPFSK